MLSIVSIIPLLSNALSVFGAFKGTAAQAKASTAIQDALGLVTALTPLVQSFASGAEVTPEQVKAALAGKDAALRAFDDEIARHGG